jgi:hypothetical protein
MAVLRSVGLSVAGILVGLVGSAFVAGMAYLGGEVFSSPFRLLWDGLLLLATLVLFLSFPSVIARYVPTRAPNFNWGANMGVVVGFFLLFVLLSGQFLRHWSTQFGGFSPNGGDYLPWTLYAVSWLLDNGLANFGQIFGWDISPIHPVNDTARSLVWAYNIALEFFAVATLVQAVRMVMPDLRESRRQDATTPATDNQTEGA